MALTYEKVISVISHPPTNRKDFEVNNLLSWFRKKSDLFRNLKQELLFDLIKNLQFVTKTQDDIIIQQGENGDCMYILLRGKVTIYIQYAKKVEDDEKAEDDKGSKPPTNQFKPNPDSGESVRQQLGTFVTHLGPGATFGEVALLKEDDCMRTASIISDETSDLIVIDRELYNRSVKNVLKQEFEDKTTFIRDNPFFQNWAPKYKKQLAMALQKEIFPYDGVITKQGDPLSAIYFMLHGEVKVTVDPSQHKHQYPKYYEHEDLFASLRNGDTLPEPKNDKVEDLIKSISSLSRERSNSEGSSNSKFRKKSQKKQPVEVCLLGVNEVIGDIETLLEMDTYMQTATCTQRTEVLVLEMKHYERLLVKRNPKTIRTMKECLDVRLYSRMHQHEDALPLFKFLFQDVIEFTAMSHEQSRARHNRKSGTNDQEKVKHHRRTVAEYFASFIPPTGALVDMYGPGTVFHRIREREKARLDKTKARKLYATPGYSPLKNGHSHIPPRNMDQGLDHMHSPSDMIDPMTSDAVLKNLEDRMKIWLQWDKDSKTQPRVAKLHRSQVEEETLKPGAKVVFRPKGSDLSPREGEVEFDDEDDKYILHGHSWSSRGASARSYGYFNPK